MVTNGSNMARRMIVPHMIQKEEEWSKKKEPKRMPRRTVVQTGSIAKKKTNRQKAELCPQHSNGSQQCTPPYLCLQRQVLRLHHPECRGVIMPQGVQAEQGKTPTHLLQVATKQNVDNGAGTVQLCVLQILRL